MLQCQIALGGNVGDVRRTFAKALRRLDESGLRVVTESRLYATPAMGANAGGTFLNAAATVETSLEPLAVLGRLLAVEDELGRVRSMHWGPRPLDLDLVFYGDALIDLPRLRVPHPGCWYRRFVLDPLSEIAGQVVHPETGETVARLRERLLARPLPVAIAGERERVGEIAQFVADRFADVMVAGTSDEAELTLNVGRGEDSARRRVVTVRDLEGAESVLTAALGAGDVGKQA